MTRKARRRVAPNRCAHCKQFLKFPLYECDDCFAEGQRNEEMSLTQGWL